MKPERVQTHLKGGVPCPSAAWKTELQEIQMTRENMNPILSPHVSRTDFDTSAFETLTTKLCCGFFCSYKCCWENKVLYHHSIKHTMYSEGAMNSIVAFWTSGLLCGSPYDLLTGLYINSSGTIHTNTHT